MLTGWAKADSVYLYRTTDEETFSADTTHLYDRKFSLMAKLFYTDGSTEEFEVDFNANNTDWQYVSTAIVPKKDVNYAEIYLLYDYNANTVYFDNISLTAEPAQTYAYDDEGNLELVTDIDGNESLLTYAENGVDVEGYTAVTGENYEYTYDDKHQLTAATRTAGSVTQTLTYDYDQYGRITSSNLSAGESNITSSLVYTDDFSGNISQITDSLGSVTNYSYDTATKLMEYVENANGNRTEYQYDYARKLATQVFLDKDKDATLDEAEPYVNYLYTNNRLSGITTDTTSYSLTYDVYGNVESIKAGDNVLATYEYAPYNGKLLKLTYGNGDYEEYVYDHLDRLVKVLYNGTEEKYSVVYNANGGIYSIVESGITHLYEYDSLGRLIRAWQKDSSGVTTLYVENTYDSLGRSTGSKYVINGETFNYKIAYKTDSNNVARFYYPTFGGDTKINFYTYDEFERLIKSDLLVDLISKASQGYEYYTYTADGVTHTTSLISKLTLNANGVETVYEYTYDSLGNITRITKDNITINTYGYDELNQLVRENDNANGYTYLYKYDLSGNLLNKYKIVLSPSSTESLLQSTTAENALDATTYGYSDSTWGDLLTDYNGTAISYDAIGNPTNWRNAANMEWEQRKLTYHTNLDGTTRTTYLYNSEGVRAYKRVVELGSAGVDTVYNFYNYTLDGTKILSQHYRNSSTKENSYLYFIYDESGNVTGFNDGTNTYFYQKNIQGDIIRILDVDGNVVTEYTYDAWGKVLSITGTLADTIGQKNPFRYRSYYYDSETGWYYLNSRYYDPEIGRFINADGYVSTGQGIIGNNMFAYCGNNPINRVDPIGEEWWHWALGAAVVVGCAAATVVTCGGFAAAAGAVVAVGSGVAATTTAATITAGAFIGSGTVFAGAVFTAASTSDSVEEFMDDGDWNVVVDTVIGGAVGAFVGYEIDKVTRANETFLSNDYYENKKAPKYSTPNSTYTNIKYNDLTGEYESSNAYYDYGGRQIIRVDWTDHGRSETHTSPHVHRYVYNNIFPEGYKLN